MKTYQATNTKKTKSKCGIKPDAHLLKIWSWTHRHSLETTSCSQMQLHQQFQRKTKTKRKFHNQITKTRAQAIEAKMVHVKRVESDESGLEVTKSGSLILAEPVSQRTRFLIWPITPSPRPTRSRRPWFEPKTKGTNKSEQTNQARTHMSTRRSWPN